MKEHKTKDITGTWRWEAEEKCGITEEFKNHIKECHNQIMKLCGIPKAYLGTSGRCSGLLAVRREEKK